MPKGRGLNIRKEVSAGSGFARAKRFSRIKRLLTDWDWPHLYGAMLPKSWKRHRKTQWRSK